MGLTVGPTIGAWTQASHHKPMTTLRKAFHTYLDFAHDLFLYGKPLKNVCGRQFLLIGFFNLRTDSFTQAMQPIMNNSRAWHRHGWGNGGRICLGRSCASMPSLALGAKPTSTATRSGSLQASRFRKIAEVNPVERRVSSGIPGFMGLGRAGQAASIRTQELGDPEPEFVPGQLFGPSHAGRPCFRDQR